VQSPKAFCFFFFVCLICIQDYLLWLIFRLATLKTDCLPFVTLTWVTENSLVVAGYDCGPVVFTHDGENVIFVARLDDTETKHQQGPKFSALKHFRNLDNRATVEANDTVLETVHQNTVTQVTIYAGTKANCTKFSTSGIDGQLVIWDIKTLESAIAGLQIV
jgi:actin related protein 2/3 complex, subunit 1A/1B